MLKLLFGGLISPFRSRRDLALENLVLRHQLQVALRNNPSPTLLDQDRIFWVWAHQLWLGGWGDHLVIVRPSTVLRWHRKGWRLYWSCKSQTKARSASAGRRDGGAHRPHVPRKPAVGDRAHPGRAAETGNRGQQSLDPSL